jgi:hypothetical protein
MSHIVVRFQSLALREDGQNSTIRFQVEDDAALTECRAALVEQDDGALDVGPVVGYRDAVDDAAFREVVERVYWEQVRRVGRLAAVVPVAGCIVSLSEAVVIESPPKSERAAAG